MTKEALLDCLRQLNGVVETTTKENSLDKIVDFYSITSHLHDHLDGIRRLKVRKRYFIFTDPKAREELDVFCKEIVWAGRDCCGFNRTQKRERVTKNNIYLGNISGILTRTIRDFEISMQLNPSDEHTQFVYEKISEQAYDFIKSYHNYFRVDFLA